MREEKGVTRPATDVEPDARAGGLATRRSRDLFNTIQQLRNHLMSFTNTIQRFANAFMRPTTIFERLRNVFMSFMSSFEHGSRVFLSW